MKFNIGETVQVKSIEECLKLRPHSSFIDDMEVFCSTRQVIGEIGGGPRYRVYIFKGVRPQWVWSENLLQKITDVNGQYLLEV